MKEPIPVFCEFLGNTPRLRILDHLINGRPFDYNITDIAEGAKVNRTQVYSEIPALIKEGVIFHTRMVGASKFYQINKDSEKAKALIKIYLLLLDEVRRTNAILADPGLMKQLKASKKAIKAGKVKQLYSKPIRPVA